MSSKAVFEFPSLTEQNVVESIHTTHRTHRTKPTYHPGIQSQVASSMSNNSSKISALRFANEMLRLATPIQPQISDFFSQKKQRLPQ